MRGLLATSRAAIAEVAGNRRALLFQMGVMIVNDLVWVAFWVLFFRTAGTVRGWDADRVILLLSVMTVGAGLALGVLSNARHLPARLTDGSLDAVLGLPTGPLGQLLVRRIEPVNVGDVVFGIGLFAVAGRPTPERAAMFVAVVLCVAVLLTSFLVTIGSLAVLAGRADAGELGFNAILMLSTYPIDLFGGGAKLLLYTVVPSAFVASVPSSLIDRWDGRSALGLAAVTVAFAAIANVSFRAALRRYSSGSAWTRA